MKAALLFASLLVACNPVPPQKKVDAGYLKGKIISHLHGDTIAAGQSIRLEALVTSSHPLSQITTTWYAGSTILCQTAPDADGLSSCNTALYRGEELLFFEATGPRNTRSSTSLDLIINDQQHPQASILNPKPNRLYYNDAPILLRGMAHVPDADPKKTIAMWESNIDGFFPAIFNARGEIENFVRLSAGEHFLRLIVEDENGQQSIEHMDLHIKKINNPQLSEIRQNIKEKAKKVYFASSVKHIYSSIGGGPIFIDGLQPNQKAKKLLAAVQDLYLHGIDRAPFKLGFSSDPFPPKKHNPTLEKENGISLLALNNAKEAAAFDVRLTNALVRYIYEFRFRRWAHATKVSRTLNSTGAKLIAEAAINLLDDLHFEALWPSNPQYPQFKKLLSGYRSLAELPKEQRYFDWKSWVSAKAASKEQPEKWASMLKIVQKRLMVEGYYQGTINGLPDEGTLLAIQAYRKNHYFYSRPKRKRDKKGKKMPAPEPVIPKSLSPESVKKLLASPQYRLALTRLNLQRLRESIPDRNTKQTYIRVNIPSYQLVLWEKGKKSREHRVIVGSNKLDFDRNTWQQGYLNRTPMLDTRMLFVVVNPSWRPPARIRDELFGGREKVIVPPGKKNPLGYAKFILDRTNAVFLHDTNNRHLFANRKRAYSHGCMRVHKAPELAQYLAMNYTGITKEKFNKFRDTKVKELEIRVNRHLPLYTEYNTMGFNPDKQLIFFDDPYFYDSALLRGKRPANKTRYGSASMRPKAVPLIPSEDYQRMRKEKRKSAPVVWPEEVPVTPSEEG